MANIKLNSINDLSSWNKKELRKLRMTIKNRLSSFEFNNKIKELPKSHPLFEKDESSCKALLEKVMQAEAKL